VACLRSGRGVMLPQPETSRALRIQYASTNGKVPLCFAGSARGHAPFRARALSIISSQIPLDLRMSSTRFASGAFAAIGFCCVVGRRGGLLGWRLWTATASPTRLHDGEVRQIIAEEGDFGFLGAGLCAGRLRRRQLCGLASHRRIRCRVLCTGAGEPHCSVQ